MATRNLSRTIIEGGRHRQSTVNRQGRNRKVRRMRFDAEGNLVGREPRLTVECFYHFDRLAPLRRWLRGNVGRPWAKVFSELCTLYDKRTMKGWHLRDHLRWEVELNPRPENYGRPLDLYVDVRGVLRFGSWRSSPNPWPAQVGEQRKAEAWAAGRRVIVRDAALFWTADIVVVPNLPLQPSRQGARLSTEEARYWAGLRQAVRSALEYVPATARASR